MYWCAHSKQKTVLQLYFWSHANMWTRHARKKKQLDRRSKRTHTLPPDTRTQLTINLRGGSGERKYLCRHTPRRPNGSQRSVSHVVYHDDSTNIVVWLYIYIPSIDGCLVAENMTHTTRKKRECLVLTRNNRLPLGENASGLLCLCHPPNFGRIIRSRGDTAGDTQRRSMFHDVVVRMRDSVRGLLTALINTFAISDSSLQRGRDFTNCNRYIVWCRIYPKSYWLRQ